MNSPKGHPLKIYRDPNLHVIFSVTLMAVLGVSSIAPVLPQIARELAISAKEASLLIAVFTLPGVLLMPVLGFLGDRLGRKTVLVPSLLLFSFAGVGCALSRDFRILLVFRFLQGSGAAALGMLNLTLIGDLYSGRNRIEAMGLNASVLSIGTATYPLLGGMIAVFGWNYPFLLSLLALPVALFALKVLKVERTRHAGAFHHYVRNLLESVLDFRIAGLYVGMIVVFIIIYGACLTAFPFFMKDTFDATPDVIGLLLTTMSAGTILAASQLRRLAQFFGEKWLVIASFSLYALICLILPHLRHLGTVAFLSFAFGFANGMNVPTMQGILTETAGPQYRAAVMSFNGMFLRLGQTIGPYLMGMIYVQAGITAAFLAAALLSVLMVILLLLAVKFRKR